MTNDVPGACSIKGKEPIDADTLLRDSDGQTTTTHELAEKEEMIHVNLTTKNIPVSTDDLEETGIHTHRKNLYKSW